MFKLISISEIWLFAYFTFYRILVLIVLMFPREYLVLRMMTKNQMLCMIDYWMISKKKMMEMDQGKLSLIVFFCIVHLHDCFTQVVITLWVIFVRILCHQEPSQLQIWPAQKILKCPIFTNFSHKSETFNINNKTDWIRFFFLKH